jgi:hypothetical protein
MDLGLLLISKAIAFHVITYTLPFPSNQMVLGSEWIESRTTLNGVSALDIILPYMWLIRVQSGF